MGFVVRVLVFVERERERGERAQIVGVEGGTIRDRIE